MKAIILSIGNELTLGETVDTNSAWLAGRLAEIGVLTVAHVTVADEREAIRRELSGPLPWLSVRSSEVAVFSERLMSSPRPGAWP